MHIGKSIFCVFLCSVMNKPFHLCNNPAPCGISFSVFESLYIYDVSLSHSWIVFVSIPSLLCVIAAE